MESNDLRNQEKYWWQIIPHDKKDAMNIKKVNKEISKMKNVLEKIISE